jgi:hypothetical protein
MKTSLQFFLKEDMRSAIKRLIEMKTVTRDIQARKLGQDWKPLKQFIEEDVEESLHELVRGNVLTATRYYEHRVKQFINKVIMGKNSPMHV